MQDHQTRLLKIAESECVPYLSELPVIALYAERISFVLVGSVATGLCSEHSDVDIALVCDEATCEAISQGTTWNAGRPSEVKLKGIQLHYYGISFERIEAKLRDLDDIWLYVYGNARVLKDPQHQYEQRFHGMLPDTPAVQKERLEGKLDMLLRRSGALKGSMDAEDPVASARICLELITLAVKVIGLLDNVSFDPRKHLFRSALGGNLGSAVEELVRDLFPPLGEIGSPDAGVSEAVSRFLRQLETLTSMLSEEARRQGFRVGLDHPERRHIEV